MASSRFLSFLLRLLPALFLLTGIGVRAETCQTSTDMDDATRTALNSAGQRYLDMILRGDTVTLRQNAIPGVAADFSGIESTVKGHQSDLAETKPTPRPSFLLQAPGTAVIPHAEFFCGVFGKSGQTANSAVFYLNNLPPGNYGVETFDANSAKTPVTVTLILQQAGSDWKIGGLYIKAMQLAGHDSAWFVSRAHEYKAKGELHNAWLYYQAAVSVVSPLDFMSTAATDKLLDEAQAVKPADFPVEGKSADLSAPGATYKLTAAYLQAIGNDLDLTVFHRVDDISNTNLTFQKNAGLMKAMLAKWPELKDGAAGINARAVDASGRDYGTLLAMKDIK